MRSGRRLRSVGVHPAADFANVDAAFALEAAVGKKIGGWNRPSNSSTLLNNHIHIPRLLARDLPDFLSRHPAVGLPGPSQAGKTNWY